MDYDGNSIAKWEKPMSRAEANALIFEGKRLHSCVVQNVLITLQAWLTSSSCHSRVTTNHTRASISAMQIASPNIPDARVRSRRKACDRIPFTCRPNGPVFPSVMLDAHRLEIDAKVWAVSSISVWHRTQKGTHVSGTGLTKLFLLDLQNIFLNGNVSRETSPDNLRLSGAQLGMNIDANVTSLCFTNKYRERVLSRLETRKREIRYCYYYCSVKFPSFWRFCKHRCCTWFWKTTREIINVHIY